MQRALDGLKSQGKDVQPASCRCLAMVASRRGRPPVLVGPRTRSVPVLAGIMPTRAARRPMRKRWSGQRERAGANGKRHACRLLQLCGYASLFG